MFELFAQGGPLFMGTLTLIFIALVATFIKAVLKTAAAEKPTNQTIQSLKSIGTLGLVVGILGQLLGLFSAFSMIEAMNGISPAMLAGGLKVSLITTVYGLLIYVLHLVFAMVLKRTK